MALGYQVAILNVWWKKGGLDVRFFSSKSDQKTWFDSKILGWSTLQNFNINDNISTVITFRDKTNRSIETLLKCNYAVVKNPSNVYRFYYITNIRADSSNQVIATLELDDIQSSFIMYSSLISSNVYVYNWTGYNYEKDTNNTGKYRLMANYYNNSLIGTDDNPVLMNKSSSEGYIEYSNIEAVNNWLNENIECWNYVYLVDNHKLVSPIMNSTWFGKCSNTQCFQSTVSNLEWFPYDSVSAPIYKSGAKNIYIKGTDIDSTVRYFKLTASSINAFFSLSGYIQGDGTLYSNNPIGTYGIVKKHSIINPFSSKSLIVSKFEIDSDGDLIISGNQMTGFENTYNLGTCYCYSAQNYDSSNPPVSKATAYIGIIGGYILDKNTFNISFTNPITYNNISSSDIKNYDSKLLDFNYSKLRIRIGNQSYDYNPIGYISSFSNTIEGKYTEILIAGTTKGYLRLNASGCYKAPNENDYTGLVASLDLTEPILSNQWADYLANNKNYYQQTQFNNTVALMSGSANAMTSKTSAQGGVKAFSTVLGYTSNIVNQQFNVDNMQQAPDSLSNANGNPYFALSISGIKPRLDYYTIPDGVLKQTISKFADEGVPINKYMSIQDIINKHSAYDFIRIRIEKTNNLINELSGYEYERLKSILQDGRRFWYSDDSTFILPVLNYFK